MAEKKGKTTLEIIRAISQAASKGFDGALEEDGFLDYKGGGEHKRLKMGLKRDDGDPILDKRVIDGFKVKFQGNKLCIHYHGEVSLKDIHRRGPKRYEEEVEAMFGEISNFLKKEYKKVTGNSLTLVSEGEAESLIQRMNRMRNWVQSYKWYKIGNISDTVGTEAGRDRDDDPLIKKRGDAIRNFLALSSKRSAAPKQPARPGLGEVDVG